jgi:hypothetical protein
MNKAQDIKVVASRIRMVLRQTEEMPMEAMFWENLKTLLNLILEVGVNSADIKTIAERLNRMFKAEEQALFHGVFWDDLRELLHLILEEEESE